MRSRTTRRNTGHGMNVQTDKPGVMPVEWPAPPNVHAFFTLRSGGASAGPFASFNLAQHVGDAPAAVAANRARLRDALSLAREPVWLSQVHGTRVIDANAAEGGSALEADGSYSEQAAVVCAVLTADCLPILLCDRAGTRVAALHAGWRGLAAGVVAAGVAAMGPRGAALLAWLGPAIGPQHFEVGPEVRQAFLARNPNAAAAFAPGRGDRWFADLYALARGELSACGVNQVFGGGLCTVSDPARFFSYRRDGQCGRMASLIWRV